MELRQEGQRVVLPSFYVVPRRRVEPTKWPQWINVNWNRLLVQYPQSRDSQESSPMDVGRSVTKQSLQMPNGHVRRFLVPQYDVSRPMEAFWVQMGLNEYVLVHRPLPGAQPPPDPRQIGQPVLPKEARKTMFQTAQPMVRPLQSAPPKLSPHDIDSLKRSIEQVKQHGTAFAQEHRLPPMQNNSKLPGRPTQLPRLEM